MRKRNEKCCQVSVGGLERKGMSNFLIYLNRIFFFSPKVRLLFLGGFFFFCFCCPIFFFSVFFLFFLGGVCLSLGLSLSLVFGLRVWWFGFKSLGIFVCVFCLGQEKERERDWARKEKWHHEAKGLLC